jgi:hypothetical protein
VRLHLVTFAAALWLGLHPAESQAQDSASGGSAACPTVDSVVRGSLKPHSYLLGRYDAAADTTHLEGGGTEPKIHVDLRLDFKGAQSALPQVGILDVLLGDPYVESARLAPDTTRLILLIDDSLRVRSYIAGRMYRRMDPYPITIQGALSPTGFALLLNATRASLVYGADTIPLSPEVVEGLNRLGMALQCAPTGIPRTP